MSQRANLVGASHGVVNGGVGVGEESLGNANVGGAAVLKVGSAEEKAGGVRWGSVEVDTCIPTISSDLAYARPTPPPLIPLQTYERLCQRLQRERDQEREPCTNETETLPTLPTLLSRAK
jgi:hypothetical protein